MCSTILISVFQDHLKFTNVPHEISLTKARPGDLICSQAQTALSASWRYGHNVSNDRNGIYFIHSTSGKTYGVTVTPLNRYYMGRFVKVISVFPQNNN